MQTPAPRLGIGPFADALKLYQDGNPEGALRTLDECPDSAAVFRLRGQSLLALKHWSEALASMSAALALSPADPAALIGAAAAAMALGQWDEVIGFTDRLLGANPNATAARHYRAKALSQRGRRPEAIAELLHVEREAPQNIPARMLLARLLIETRDGRAKAEEIARLLVARQPDNHAAHQLLGECLVRAEKFAEGWEELAWRRRGELYAQLRRPFSVRSWQGENLSGKLLVLPDIDQGIGIEMLCASFYRELLGRGLSLVVESSDRLIPVLQPVFPEIEFHPLRDPPEPRLTAPDIEASATLFDLVRVLRPDVPSFGVTKPFLVPTPRPSLSRRRPVIGLAWSSVNPVTGTGRSIALPQLAGAFRGIDADFVTLQYGDVSQELASAYEQTGMAVRPPEADFKASLTGFVEALSKVDLAISIQNTTVHFAGAMDKPCWVLLPENSLWIWGNERREGLWYRSVELFRSHSGEWQPLLDCVTLRLRSWIEESSKPHEC